MQKKPASAGPPARPASLLSQGEQRQQDERGAGRHRLDQRGRQGEVAQVEQRPIPPLRLRARISARAPI